ncbi:Na+-translocating ferredoxin:NAD+ oxidoreductase RnfG subunit [Methanomicrobium sp. W14]|uniref:hypothetical protein n=1 Tax=Methanomicrobium sp. W14 TaxID=2817839 RepID=UPI001AE53F47|nr:hypothetical protein [Methanomicrobium sp. W14]MBP2134415.1 Na+-translocating ferredoxin:NAD+ oxidoreductase RnfG subunit [Methanomicrobium sp. W14]
MEEKKGHFEKGVWIDDTPLKDNEKPLEKNDKPEEAYIPVSYESEDSENSGAPGEDTTNAGYDGDIDRLVSEAAESVKKAVDSVVNLANTLIGTKSGRKSVEKKARKAGEKLIKSVEDIVSDAKRNF